MDHAHLRHTPGSPTADARPMLRVTTEEIPDPGPLADQMPSAAASAWIHYGSGMIGYGEAARYVATSIGAANAWWHRVTADALLVGGSDQLPSGAGLIAFGSFVFDPARTGGQSVLTVPEVVIGRREGKAWRTEIQPVGAPSAVHAADTGHSGAANISHPGMISYADGNLSGPGWERMVAAAVGKIRNNQLDKVVLARELLASAERPIDPRGLVARLERDYPRCWTYHVNGLVGATPEMLIRRENGLATSRVLAGTVRRTPTLTQDAALGAALSESSKDLAEHQFAVSSVAEALAPYCSGMNVPDMPSVLELPNVLHLATDVTAAADRYTNALTLAAALHPSAAVCGTPTAVARATIAELEQLDRDRYAGPIGWIDAAGDGEWGIALRCGKINAADPCQIRLYAGCGIVADSDPQAELAESNAKLVVMRDALEG